MGRDGGLMPGLVVGMMDGSSPADECGLSSALVLSLYFPYPPDQLSASHTSCTPSCPLFPTITIRVPTA